MIFSRLGSSAAICSRLVFLVAMLVGHQVGAASGVATGVMDVSYHLTARPWTPMNVPRDAYLDRLEGVVRYIAGLQDATGAIIEPGYIEYQQATPYFANAVGVLLSTGRALDLLDEGVAAMEHVSLQMAQGNRAIPQQHGNFFVAPMAEALSLYAGLVPKAQIDAWRGRMMLPIKRLVLLEPTHNWRTYAMKGEWYRAQRGLVQPSSAMQFIEDSWIKTQRARLVGPRRLYHDTSSDPDAFAYDAASRAELWSLVAEGYNGPSAGEMASLIMRGTRSALLLQDANGQTPYGGRSAGMTWNDVYSGLGFEMMAERVNTDGQPWLAGQFRRAALLALQSADRWRSSEGFYFVAKNRFETWRRVGFPVYAALTNYNGFVMYHLGEAYRARVSAIKEAPAPVEIGGYAMVPDADFGIAFANAGGMQIQVSLRGTQENESGQYWTKLGLTRFSRVKWDSRLGPSDGVREAESGIGVSFAPTFLEGGAWVRMADSPLRYQASFSAQFTHPLLVRCRIDYVPQPGQSGPSFTDDLVITPDGVLSTVRSDAAAGTFGVSWPLFVNDGETRMRTRITSAVASTAYSAGGDQQNFIALDSSPVLSSSPRVQGTYGDVKPIRVVAGDSIQTFIYPRNGADPSAETVRSSFTRNGKNFSTVLGRVEGTIYVGRTAAGGVGSVVDLDGNGSADVTFSQTCGFIVQLRNGKIKAIEADRAVTASVAGRAINLNAYTPKTL